MTDCPSDHKDLETVVSLARLSENVNRLRGDVDNCFSAIRTCSDGLNSLNITYEKSASAFHASLKMVKATVSITLFLCGVIVAIGQWYAAESISDLKAVADKQRQLETEIRTHERPAKNP